MPESIQRPRWYPHFQDQSLDDAFLQAFNHLYHLQDSVKRLNDTAGKRLTALETTPDTAAIKKELQIGGNTPLNVNGLLGQLAQPQVAGAGVGSVLPALTDPLSQSGSLFIVTGANTLNYFKVSTEPGVWTAVAATGTISFGLRSAKPAAGNSGYTYFETDTGWYYYDNGTNYLYLAGINKGTDATRTGLTIGTNDNGALFYTTDTNVLWRVAAGAWAQAFISLTAGITGVLPIANGGLAGTSLSDGANIKHKRVTTGSVAAGADVSVTVTWTTGFADANYTVQASIVEATATAVTLRVHHIQSTAAGSVVVNIINDDGVNAHTGTLHCMGVHD